MMLTVRRYMFPRSVRHDPKVERSLGGFHLHQYAHTHQPIRPPAFEDVDARTVGRHKRRAAARARRREVAAAAHALRVSRMRAARAGR